MANQQNAPPHTPMPDQNQYKNHSDLVWNIANLLRGPYRPPQYRKVMIPLTVLRRLDCVLEPSQADVVREHVKLSASNLSAEAIEGTINHKFKLAFHNTSNLNFATLLNDPEKLATNLKAYISGFSSRARAIIEKFKFEEEIDKLDEANRLYEIIKEFKDVDLYPERISNAAMGYIFGKLLGGSLVVTIFVYVTVNIMMVSGLIPVVGVPLPFVSYGGTALVSLGCILGIIMGLRYR